MGEGKPSTSEAGFFLSQALTFSQHGLGLHPKTPRSDIEITNLEYKILILASFARQNSLSSASRCDESALKSHLNLPRSSGSGFKWYLNPSRSFGSGIKWRLRCSRSSGSTFKSRLKCPYSSGSAIKSHLNPSRRSESGFKSHLNLSRGFARGNFITEIRRHGCGGGTK